MSNEAENAGYIAAGVAAFIAGAFRVRTMLSSDKRKITHDENTSKWEASILEENAELRKQITTNAVKNEEAWLRHVDDGKRIAQLQTELQYVRQELSDVRVQLAQLKEKDNHER